MRVLVGLLAVAIVAGIVYGIIYLVSHFGTRHGESRRALKKRADELDLLVDKIERKAIQYNTIDHPLASVVLDEIDAVRQKEITK